MDIKSKDARGPLVDASPGGYRHAIGFSGWVRAVMQGVDARELLGGLFLFALGLFAAVYAQRYAFGSLTRMGPGFFPVVLGVLLCGYGALIALLALLRGVGRAQLAAGPGGEPEAVQWRNLVIVTLGLILFGVLLRTAGMVVATLVSVVLYTLADRGCHVLRSVTLAVSITGLTLVLFVWGLQMPVPVWWN